MKEQTVFAMKIYMSVIQYIYIFGSVYNFNIVLNLAFQFFEINKTSAWSLWLIRNGIVFKYHSFDLVAILDLIKIRSWSNWFVASAIFLCKLEVIICLCLRIF